jgi:sirohydrochlorin cobaltochelatase
MVTEMRRGIWETTGLYAESAGPGWLAVTCESPTMAAWMCAAIILENVAARVDDDRLLLPAGPGFTLKDEVKSVITVVAKTHHYWSAHAAAAGE